MEENMDKNKDNEICVVSRGMIQYTHEVMNMSCDNINLLNKVYREISEELGVEAALAIHHMFKGTQVCFPIRFFDTNCVKEMIIKEYDGTNVAALAKKYNYSEKTIRRIIKESIKKKS